MPHAQDQCSLCRNTFLATLQRRMHMANSKAMRPTNHRSVQQTWKNPAVNAQYALGPNCPNLHPGKDPAPVQDRGTAVPLTQLLLYPPCPWKRNQFSRDTFIAPWPQ